MKRKPRVLNIKCKIEGCDRSAMYKEDCVCQMHYFRFMRNGSYELQPKPVRKLRTQNQKGYQMLFEPDHPLAMKNGHVYEHRKVVFEHFQNQLPDCELCGCSLSWSNCHIDHIDENIKNNELSNLRPICRSCNTMRSHISKPKHQHKRHHSITYNGLTMTATEWSRQPNIKVAHKTIVNRLRNGWSVESALFTESLTHPNAKVKVRKTKYKNQFELNAEGIQLD